jgi:tetratricopeptide (TPR) repeat protein
LALLLVRPCQNDDAFQAPFPPDPFLTHLFVPGVTLFSSHLSNSYACISVDKTPFKHLLKSIPPVLQYSNCERSGMIQGGTRIAVKGGMAGINSLRSVLGWACVLLPAFLCPVGAFGTPDSTSVSEKNVLSRVVSIKAKTTEGETLVTVKGDGIIREYEEQTFPEPPRIVVDLLCPSKGFETEAIPLACPILERVRIGHHPDRIRIVLDVKNFPIPAFSLRGEKNSLFIRISHDMPRQADRPETGSSLESEEVVVASGDAGPKKKPVERYASGTQDQSDDSHDAEGAGPTDVHFLVGIDGEGGADTLLFLEGITAFREENWIKAVESLRAIQEKHPQGRYDEKASFLLAKSYEHLKEPDIATYFEDVRNHYETFLNRFPASEYGGEALVAVGDLFFRIGHHAEAMGYYRLAFSRDKNSPAAAEALAGQMKIHMLKRRYDEALSVSNLFLQDHPQSPKTTDIKLETARILYVLNRFQESLTRLMDLQGDGLYSTYLRPDISLYLGYNGYQLGNFPMARENLFRFYNVTPRAEEIPLVLTKIGDTYRDEKCFDAASKLYRWVAERYPDSEGALISQIRLAELQEQGRKTAQEKGIGFGARPGERILSPREVYETMLQNATSKDGKNPLVALALLKLAVVYQEEGDYGSSLAMVKELLARFPGQQLQKETEHVLLKTLQGALNDSIGMEDYYGAIRFYYEEKELFHMADAPDLYLAIARAFLDIGLRDDATSLFKKAGSLLLDDEKPSDMLQFLALDLYRGGESDQALDKLNAAVRKGRDSDRVCEAYGLMGRILAERMQWEQALEAFDKALMHSSEPCIRSEILTEKASTQEAQGMKEVALTSARKAGRLIAECESPSLFAYEGLGGLFSRLGRPEEALNVFTEATGRGAAEKGQERIRWKLAQTYEVLGEKEASLSAYRDLADLGDPLWSHLAKAKIEEIRFLKDMESFKRK